MKDIRIDQTNQQVVNLFNTDSIQNINTGLINSLQNTPPLITATTIENSKIEQDTTNLSVPVKNTDNKVNTPIITEEMINTTIVDNALIPDLFEPKAPSTALTPSSTTASAYSLIAASSYTQEPATVQNEPMVSDNSTVNNSITPDYNGMYVNSNIIDTSSAISQEQPMLEKPVEVLEQLEDNKDNPVEEINKQNQGIKAEIEKLAKEREENKAKEIKEAKAAKEKEVKENKVNQEEEQTELQNKEKIVTDEIQNTDTNTQGNSKIKITIKKDGNGQWYVEKPKTMEMKLHDSYMAKKLQDYLKNNPEPKFSQSGLLEDSESAKHANWQSKYNKNMQKLEQAYQKENKIYYRQYTAYKQAQLKAEQMNQENQL